MELHAGHHVVVQLLGLNVNLDTLMMTWLVAALVIIVTVSATRGRPRPVGPAECHGNGHRIPPRPVQGNVGTEIRPSRIGLIDHVLIHPVRQRIGHDSESGNPGFAYE